MYEQDIKDQLGQLLTLLQLPFDEIATKEDADMTRVDIKSSIPSKIIGWHGETLNSLQHMVKSMLRTKHNLDRAPFLVFDTDGYRLSQERKVCSIAEQKAGFVRRTGSRVALPPMSPYFRRIVHMHIANSESLQDLTTESSGEGDYRQVILRLKDEKSAKIKPSDDDELAPVIEGEDDLANLDI